MQNIFIVMIDTSTGVGSDWYSAEICEIFSTHELAEGFVSRQEDQYQENLWIDEWAVNTELPEWDGEE